MEIILVQINSHNGNPSKPFLPFLPSSTSLTHRYCTVERYSLLDRLRYVMWSHV